MGGSRLIPRNNSLGSEFFEQIKKPLFSKIRTWHIVLIFLVLTLMAFVPFLLTSKLEVEKILSSVLLPLYSMIATATIAIAGIKSYQFSRKVGLAWLVIGLALTFNTAGEIAFSILNWIGMDPYPSLADIFFLASYPSLLIGILLFPSVKMTRRDMAIRLLEIAIIVFSGGLMMWNNLIGPIIDLSIGDELLIQFFNIAYPVFDLFLLLALMSLIFSTNQETKIRPLVFLGAGIFIWIFSDISFSLQEIQQSFQSGGLSDVGYLFASILFMVVGLCQLTSSSHGFNSKLHNNDNDTKKFIFTIPIIRSFLGPIMLILFYRMLWRSWEDPKVLPFEIMMTAIGVLLILVSMLQFFYTWQNSHLNSDLRKSNMELENRVQERTKTLEELSMGLRQSEELYRALVEDSSALVCTFSTDGTISFINQTMAKYLGFEPNQLLGKSFFDLILPQDREKSKRRITSHNETLDSIVEEYRIQTEDGDIRWLRWIDRLQIVGNSTQHQAVGEDITEFKKASEQLQESEERYRMLFETMQQGVVYQGQNGRILFSNSSAANILGLTIDQMQGKKSIDTTWRSIHEDGSEFSGESHPAMVALQSGKVISNIIMGVFNPNDEDYRWINITSVPEFLPGEIKPFRVYSTFQDVTAQKRSEKALNLANNQLTSFVNELSLIAKLGELLQLCQDDEEAFNAVRMIIPEIFPNEQGFISIVNPNGTYDTKYKWGPSDVTILSNANQCLALRRGKTFYVGNSNNELVCNHLKGLKDFSSICTPLVANNEVYGLFHIQITLENNSNGLEKSRVQLAEMVANSIALAISNIHMRNKLSEQSIRDPLTGMYNRRFMDESLLRELERAQRNGQTLGLILIDIDHFKLFNDKYGHGAGDLLLSKASTFMRQVIRGSDFACRYGGEEFVIVFPEIDSSSLMDRAERIRHEISQLRIDYQDKVLDPVTVSIGTAIYPKDGLKSDQLLRFADQAMYRAKSEGRNLVR